MVEISSGLTEGNEDDDSGVNIIGKYLSTIKQLLLDIETSYIFAMKLAIVKHDLVVNNGSPTAFIPGDIEFKPLLDPLIRSSHREKMMKADASISGVVEQPFPPSMGLYVVQRTLVPEVSKLKVFNDSLIRLVGSVFYRYLVISDLHLLDVSRGNILHAPTLLLQLEGEERLAENLRKKRASQILVEKAPRAMARIVEHCDVNGPVLLKHYIADMRKHLALVTSALNSEFRRYIVLDTQDNLASKFNFFIESRSAHYQSPLHILLKKIDIIMQHNLTLFLHSSLQVWVNFIKAFVPYHKLHILPCPLLKMKFVESRDGCHIEIEPEPQKIIDEMVALVASVGPAVESVESCEWEMVPCVKDMQRTSMLPGVAEGKALKAASKVTKSVVVKCLEAPTELLEDIKRFEYLLTENPIMPDPLNLDEVREVRHSSVVVGINFLMFK